MSRTHASHSADAAPAPAHPSAFDFKTLFHVLVERFWIILLCFVVGALLAAVYIQRAPILYAATTTLLVQQEEQKVVQMQKVQQEDLRGLDALRTIEHGLKSRSLLTRVAEVNNLSRDPTFWPAATGPTLEQAAHALGNMIEARLRRGTRFIDVTVTHPNAELTAKIANSLVKEFMTMNFEQSTSTSADAVSFLTAESRRLGNELKEAEDRLLEYRRKGDTSISVEERNDIVSARLRELNATLTIANANAIKAKADYAQVTELGTNVSGLMVLPAVNADFAVAEARSVISKLEGEFASLKQRYLPAHPKYIERANQLALWHTTHSNAVLSVPQRIKAAYAAAAAAERALQDELTRQSERARQLSDELVQYQKLVRDVDSRRTLYETVQNRLRETTLTAKLPPSKVTVNDLASAPKKPFSPDKQGVFIRGLLGGLVAGILLALGVNAMDSSIKTVDHAEEVLHLPVLSAIPQVKAHTQLIVREDGKSPGAEAFRTLRTSVTMLGKAEHRRTFLFTSAVPQEGKTFCSTNFSICLAQQGLKTLLIDGDLRRPAVQQALVGKDKSLFGVTDYLTGQKKFEEVVQAHVQENFAFVPAGTIAPNPAELLAQGGFEGLIEEALLHFDRVVVDSAPIHAVSDTLMMLNRIQTLCLVVRAGKTPRKAVVRAVDLLYKAEAPIAGIVLNRQKRKRLAGYHYDPYYNYSYQGKYAEKGVYGAR